MLVLTLLCSVYWELSKWNHVFTAGIVSAPTSKVQCPALITPEQGTVSCRHHLGTFGLNTTCYFGCKAGFILMGDSALRCRPSGKWTAGTPTCQGNGKGTGSRCSKIQGKSYSKKALKLSSSWHSHLKLYLPVEIPSNPNDLHVSSSMKSTPIPVGGNVPQACHFSPCYVTSQCPSLKDIKEEIFANVRMYENKHAEHETNYKNLQIQVAIPLTM